MLAVALTGWSALLVAQIVMVRWFGFEAGHPGFKYIQLFTLPIATVNFAASLWITRQSKQAETPAPGDLAVSTSGR